jgi:potassium efflux system protein
MEHAARVTLALGFLAAVCRPGGLGACHFGWNQEILARFRSAIHWFLPVYVPALLLTTSSMYGAAADYFDSVGRVSFILAHAWTAVLLWRLLQGPNGVLTTFTREHPTGLVTRWRHLWFPLLLAFPLVLILFASLGYLITAMEFSLGLIMTLALIAGGSVLYGLALRRFKMKQRKLALAEAIERRRARQEAAASEEPQEQAAEIVTVDPEDDEERDLESISEQTRTLLRLAFSVAVGVAIIVFWSQTFPLIAVVDSIPVPLTEGLTLLGLLQAVLILVVGYFAVQNLPGLIELAVLRTKTIDAGTRTAITTLCQYAVIGIGLVLLFNVLNVDWAKFGWIAAALSVGLGFGLQEVVANFVCGLILLFECPIRVGDVVTVENVTGTVTKIRMRATTITNWDRQEFVVPNKTLITNTLLNWTLSAAVNRIVIPVGVAYGSDTELARQILLDAAADHPLVLDDPAPMATFEEFADSSLALVLRAFLPNLDNRLATITELHTEISKRFAAAGIEIAFPQQDLHLRSGWDDARRQRPEEAEER